MNIRPTAAILASALLLGGTPAIAEDIPPTGCGGTDLLSQMQQREPRAYKRLVREVERTPNARGQYWRVEHPDAAAPSLLMGTVHTSDPRIIASVPAEITQALEGGWKVLVEVTRKDVIITAQNPALIMAEPGQAFDRTYTAAQKNLAREVLAQYGAPYQQMRMMKPFVIASMLATPPCLLPHAMQYPILDHHLQAIAPAGTVALETAAEQLGMFDKLEEKNLKALLLGSFATAAGAEDQYETLLRAYLRDGTYLASLYAQHEGRKMSAELGIDHQAAWDEFERVLINERNHTMVERALPHLMEGKKVIAVGVLHLPGKEGIVELLRKAGFTLTPLKD